MSLVGHYLLHFIALHGINLTTTVDLIAADDDFLTTFAGCFIHGHQLRITILLIYYEIIKISCTRRGFRLYAERIGRGASQEPQSGLL